MVTLASPTREALLQRRRRLRQQRRSRFWQGSWRLTSSTALLLALALGIRQPYWLIHQPEQIQVQGAEWVDPDWVRSQLPLPYPIPIWQVQPAVLEKALLGSPTQPSPIARVQVQRRLLPVGLIVQIQERQPVARALRDHQPGLVDREGNWIALHLFHTSAAGAAFTPPLPQLELRGWEDHPPEKWALLLQALQQLDIPVTAVDWQGGEAITLHTQLGRVYLGPMSERLPLQIATLNQMRDLRRYCNCTPEEIVHIDLTSPTVPTLELTPAASQARWQQKQP